MNLEASALGGHEEVFGGANPGVVMSLEDTVTIGVDVEFRGCS